MVQRMQKLPGPVLVTGAGGFIGRRLLNRLLAEGSEVVALDVISCPESLAEVKNLNWVVGDICDAGLLDKTVSSCAMVFHLAAMVGDWGERELHQRVTVEGTRFLFDAAMKHGARVLLASSIVVYGEKLGQGVCHEGLAHGQPFGPYSEAKQAQERLAHAYLQRGVDVRTVRPANVYGAGSKPWVEELCAELKKGIPALIGGGNFNAGLVHVDNLVDIMMRAARVTQGRGQIYNAADEEYITWKKYMTDLAKICGAPSPRSIPRVLAESLAGVSEPVYRLLKITQRPPLTREALNLVGSDHRVSVDKAHRELSYKQLTDYQQGIAEVRDYLA